MPFVKGQSGNPAGKAPGTLNKTTVAAREFLAKLCDDPKVQAAVRRKVLKGETMGFFKAIDKIVPDPPRQIAITGEMKLIQWPDNEDVRES